MSTLTRGQLTQCAPDCPALLIDAYLPDLNAALAEFEVTRPGV